MCTYVCMCVCLCVCGDIMQQLKAYRLRRRRCQCWSEGSAACNKMSHSQKNADREAAEAEAEAAASVANSRCQNSPRTTTNAATMDKFFHSSFFVVFHLLPYAAIWMRLCGLCVCVLCESALDREAEMVLAANAENNNKEHKSNRREAWEQLYPPVPTLALLYSRTLALSQLVGLCFPSLLPLTNCSLLLSLSLSLAPLSVCVRGLLCCVYLGGGGWVQ